jgi:hypothetical protein
VDVRDASQDQLIHTTQTNHLSFSDRSTVVQMALSVEQCQYPRPGMYLVELFCE